MKKSLVTTAVVGMFAGELFLIQPNITDHRIAWPVVFVLWVVFGASSGYVGDTLYNQMQAGTEKAVVRFFLLLMVITGIFFAAFIYSSLVYLIA